MATTATMATKAEGGGDLEPVTEADLAGLPDPVQRYLPAMGVVNRPRDWSFQAHLTGRFRLRGQGSWMPAEVWQYNSALEVARIFHMRLDFAGVVPMVGRDTYLGGRGIIFTRSSASWQLPEGPLSYLEFNLSAGDVRYSLAPADIAPKKHELV